MADIDSLSIQISTDATSAEKGLETLRNTLDRLKDITKGGLGLTSIANQVKRLSDSANNVNSTTVSNLKGLAEGMKKLSEIGNIKISSSVANQITRINTALSGLNIGDGENKIKELVSALKPLETLGKSSLSTTVTALNKLPDAIQKIDMRKLHGQVDALTRTFRPLAEEMQKIANGFNAFPSRIQRLIQDNERLSHSNTQVGTSYINLYAKLKMAFNTIKTVARTLAKFIKLSNDYVEDVNLFTASMGEYANKAQEYAEQVGEIMGIDPGEWMRNQGVFMTLATGFGVVGDRAYIMSKNLTQLGYDISSFFNIPYEDAMLKLQSGLAGELEPLRRIGYDLSVARLQQEAYTLGINKKVSAMTQAEKAELRYYAIMTQVTTAQGDMARTLNAPANQLRILIAQVTQAGRAIGNIFIPMLNAVLPYLIATAKVVRILAQSLADLFGFEMPEIDYSGMNGLASGADDVSSALDGASDSAKKLQKYTMGFDELNVIDPDKGNSSGGNTGGVGGSSLGFALPEYDFIGKAVEGMIDGIVGNMMLTLEDVFLNWGNNITAENLLEKIVVGLGAVAGGIIGFKIGGVGGAVLGATIGTAIGLIVSGLVFDHDRKVSFSEFYELLKNLFIVGAGGILGFTIGGFSGAGIGITIGFSLMMLLEAIEMSGNHSGANVLENLLVGAGIIGIGVGIGKKFGNTFLQGFDNVFSAGGGFTKSLSGGVQAVNAGLTPIQQILNTLVVGVTAFVAGFTGVKNITSDILSGTASASTILTGLIPTLGAIALGIYGIAVAVTATGIGAIIQGIAIAVLAIGGAVAGFASGIKEAGEMAYESSDDFKIMSDSISNSNTTIENCKTALENMKTGIENIQGASDNFAMASSLVNEIMDINENANASAYELAEMQTKVEILNGLGIDGLSLSIDETTGRVIESREAVDKLIKSLEKEARMEATRDLLVQAYKDQYQAMNDVKKATNDIDVANEALRKTSEELANCPWYDFTKKAELKTAIEKETEAVRLATEAQNTAKDTLDSLDGTIDTYIGNLADMKLEEEGIGAEVVAGMADVQTSLTETAKEMPKLGADISNGLLDGVETQTEKDKQSWLDWAWLSWNWFKEKNEIHSPSQLFFDGGSNIAIGLLKGVSENTNEGDYESVFARLGKWANQVFEITGGKSAIFRTVGEYITDGLFTGVDGGVIQDTYKKIFDRVTSALSSIKGDVVDVVNSILGFIEKLANGVIRGVNSMIDKLNSLSIDVPEWVTEKFGIEQFGFNIRKLSTITVPRIELKEDGGFLSTGQMFIAREAGPELVGNIGRRTAVVNNEQIVSSVSRGVAEANSEQNKLLREQNSLLRSLLEKGNDVYLDSKKVTSGVEKRQRERGRAILVGGGY